MVTNDYQEVMNAWQHEMDRHKGSYQFLPYDDASALRDRVIARLQAGPKTIQELVDADDWNPQYREMVIEEVRDFVSDLLSRGLARRKAGVGFGAARYWMESVDDRNPTVIEGGEVVELTQGRLPLPLDYDSIPY